MEIVDTHAHLTEFEEDLDKVIGRAVGAGVTRILCVGTDLASSRRAVEIARQFPGVVAAAVGIHPNRVAEASEAELSEVESLARLPEVVAIGETGLDFFREFSPHSTQLRFFQEHLRLATDLAKPLVIHARNSEQQVLVALEGHAGRLTGIRHCFSSSAQVALRYVELGMHISFAANVARAGHRKLKSAAAAVPADKLLVETDSPYMAHPSAGAARNEPAFITHTVEALSSIRGVSAESLAEQTTQNARALLRI